MSDLKLQFVCPDYLHYIRHREEEMVAEEEGMVGYWGVMVEGDF